MQYKIVKNALKYTQTKRNCNWPTVFTLLFRHMSTLTVNWVLHENGVKG
jgi:hypothetical protein